MFYESHVSTYWGKWAIFNEEDDNDGTKGSDEWGECCCWIFRVLMRCLVAAVAMGTLFWVQRKRPIARRGLGGCMWECWTSLKLAHERVADVGRDRK